MADARAVPVLMYHHVSPAPGLITVAPEVFRAQMAWLARHGYQSIGGADLARYLAGELVPDKSVLITFDDGYLDNWVHAAPVLAEFGLRALLFLITGRIGEGPPRPRAGMPDAPRCPSHRACMERIAAGDCDGVMLRWSEVVALNAAGVFEFHSHTHSHTRWDKQTADREARRRLLGEDLVTARELLHEHLGTASDHLCWPQGYYDDDYIAVARSLGYRFLHTTEPGTVTPGGDALRIPRIVVKDKAGAWFAQRLWLYRRPRLARLYLALKKTA